MKLRILVLLLVSVLLSLLMISCSPPANGPVTAQGETPSLFKMIPDASYLLIAHADVPALLKSPLGSRLLNQVMGDKGKISINGSTLEDMITEAILTVEFNSRYFPDFGKSLLWQLALRVGVDMEVIKGFIALNVTEINSYKGQDVYATDILFGRKINKPVYLTINDDVLIVTTSREQVEAIIKTRLGESATALGGMVERRLLSQADMTSPLWFVSEQTEVSRNLLQQFGLAPYQQMRGYCLVEESLKGALEMEFDKGTHARRTALSFDQILKSIEQFSSPSNPESDYGVVIKLMGDSVIADYQGTLAWFTWEFDSKAIDTMLDLATSPPAPVREEEMTGEITNEDS